MGAVFNGKILLLLLSLLLLLPAGNIVSPELFFNVLIYNNQIFFKNSSTQAVIFAGFRILFISNYSALIILIFNISIKRAFI